MRGLIIEGVTGAGKTQTLESLLARRENSPKWLAEAQVFREEETLGELMDEEMLDPKLTSHARCWRLHKIMKTLEASDRPFILERFHLSYYALMSDWDLYADIDQRLGSMGCHLLLLTLPQAHARQRSLFRPDRAGTEWVSDMVESFGSEQAVLEAVVQSQNQRIESLKLTCLPATVIDTNDMSWPAYARQIAEQST